MSTNLIQWVVFSLSSAALFEPCGLFPQSSFWLDKRAWDTSLQNVFTDILNTMEVLVKCIAYQHTVRHVCAHPFYCYWVILTRLCTATFMLSSWNLQYRQSRQLLRFAQNMAATIWFKDEETGNILNSICSHIMFQICMHEWTQWVVLWEFKRVVIPFSNGHIRLSVCLLLWASTDSRNVSEPETITGYNVIKDRRQQRFVRA